MSITVKVDGLDEVMRRTNPKILRGPLRKFLTKVALEVERRAREKAPVDTGHLRRSLTHLVDGAAMPSWAKIGSNLSYAPYMEFGTGVFAEGEGKKGGRHWPPGDALGGWAKRHGFASGFMVARAIGLRGGLRPRRYLRNGFKEARGKIQALLGAMKAEIAKGSR